MRKRSEPADVRSALQRHLPALLVSERGAREGALAKEQGVPPEGRCEAGESTGTPRSVSRGRMRRAARTRCNQSVVHVSRIGASSGSVSACACRPAWRCSACPNHAVVGAGQVSATQS